MPRTGETRALNLFTRMNPENLILKKQQQLKMTAYKQLKESEDGKNQKEKIKLLKFKK